MLNKTEQKLIIKLSELSEAQYNALLKSLSFKDKMKLKSLMALHKISKTDLFQWLKNNREGFVKGWVSATILMTILNIFQAYLDSKH